jgi:hypothetical protein
VFDEKGITINEAVEARKQKIEGDDAWNLLSGAEKIVVGKGKKIVTFDSKKDDREEILKACLGRTGNLRAPTLKISTMLVVGFNEDMYNQYVG